MPRGCGLLAPSGCGWLASLPFAKAIYKKSIHDVSIAIHESVLITSKYDIDTAWARKAEQKEKKKVEKNVSVRTLHQRRQLKGDSELVCYLWEGRRKTELVCYLWEGRRKALCYQWKARGRQYAVSRKGNTELVCLSLVEGRRKTVS